MRNHSYENDFDLHENGTACRTHFHMKGFALRLILKRRHKRTRKWPIPKVVFKFLFLKSSMFAEENESSLFDCLTVNKFSFTSVELYVM